MHIDPQVVAELRALFLDGATPSRLVRHIATRHEGDPSWPSHVEPYFAEAFAVTTFVMADRPPEADLDRHNLSELDVDILRDMVGRQAGWRHTVAHAPGAAWCDDLSVSTDDLRMGDQVRPESHPALADSWASMSPRAREFVRQAMVNAQGYYERMHVLVRLAERLQEQVIDLERLREGAGA
jgi:hypothetical protein